MKIGVLTNYYLDQVGGAEEALDQLATHWHQAGHEVVLFSCRARRKQRRPWQPEYRHVPLPRLFSTRYGLSRYVRPLRREQAKRPMDVLLACDAYWAGYVARRFSRRSGVPYVVCSQGGDVMHGSRFLKRAIPAERMSWAIRDAHGLACISSYIRGRMEALAKPRGIIRVLPNGWPDGWSGRQVPRVLVSGRYIFSMGRVVKLKGFQTLVAAFARVRSDHPDVSLVVAGEGDYLPQLREQAEGLGLSPTRHLPPLPQHAPLVCFPGFVHGETKRSLIHHATAAVSPSIRQEPMSLALFEMLSCGVPVIGSDVGGTPDVVRPDINGDLFPAGDESRLASCLDQLLADPPLRDRLAAAALPSVEPYRWNCIAEGYLQLFSDVRAAVETGGQTMQDLLEAARHANAFASRGTQSRSVPRPLIGQPASTAVAGLSVSARGGSRDSASIR